MFYRGFRIASATGESDKGGIISCASYEGNGRANCLHRYIIIETRGEEIFLSFLGGFKELKNFLTDVNVNGTKRMVMNEENLFTKRCMIIRLSRTRRIRVNSSI